jgi:hypothetical protein
MKPTRAAWLFAAGLVWLVLRGVLVQAFPMLGTENAVREGGMWLALPLISVVAGLAVPLFFFAFLRHHRFDGQTGLRATTVLALVMSLLSSAVMVLSMIEAVRGVGPADGAVASAAPWLTQAVPAGYIVSVFLFLVAFAAQCPCGRRLARNAAIAAVGTLVPIFLMTGWLVHATVEGALPWFPAVSQSVVVKLLGLAAAGALLLFLESFAVGYEDGPSSDRNRARADGA